MLANTDTDEAATSGRLYKVLILGFALIVIGIIVVTVAASFNAESSVGVVIFIGPIPIVFGAGQNAVLLILIGVILAVLMVIFSYVMFRKWRSSSG